jgi:hypothetical protein
MEFLLDDDLDIDLDQLALLGVQEPKADATVAPPREAPRVVVPQAATPQAVAAQAATPQPVAPQAAAPRVAAPREAAPTDKVPTADSPVMDGQAWFEAASPFGPLWLCVQTDGAVRHAAAAAVSLQWAASVLDAFDDWSALELDWRWTPVPQAADAGSHLVMRWPTDEASRAAHLVLPWALLRQLPPPTGTLVDAVHWEPAQATVVVASLALPADELDALEAGGAVVLPESMRTDWRGMLRARGEPLGVGAALGLTVPHAPQVLPRDAIRPTLTTDADTVPCEVRLASTPMVAIERLAGWQPGDVGNLGERAVLWRCDGVPRRCAAGSLMPWGDGWALAIDTVQSR